MVVSLVDAAMKRQLRIAAGDDGSLRTLAENVDRFTGFGLLDTTAETPAVIPAADVGRPLRPVPSAAEEPRILRPPPVQSTLTVSNPGGALRVEFAAGNAGCFRLLVCAVIGILAVIGYTAVQAESLNRWLIYPIAGGIAIMLLMIFGSDSVPVRRILEASVSGLQISRHHPFGTKQFTVPPASVREFRTGELAFTIRWDSGQWHTLGLTTDEKTWLAAALSEALAAPVVLEKASA
jgi:hypothetical protein